jgi:hypothetical protein
MTGSSGGSQVDERPVSRAYLVAAGDFSGTVHSVFPTACNIAVGDQLITVQDAAKRHTPTSVRVAAYGPGSWAPSVRVGDRAVQRAGVLSFGRHALHVGRVPVWAPGPVAHWAPASSSTRHRLAQLSAARADHLRAGAHTAAPELELDARALAALLPGTRPEPGTAGRASDAPGLEPAVARLVGAGPGLTPSGDDVLVGLLAALSRGGHGCPWAAVASDRVGEIVLRYAHRTTDISAHYLRLAARGHVGEPLSDLLDSLVTGLPAEALLDRASDVLSVGASSGADALLGVLAGLDAVLKLPLQPQTDEKVA